MLLNGHVKLGTVDTVGRPKITGGFEFVGVDVYRDDPRCSGHLCTLNYRKAHRPQSEDGNSGVCLDLTGVPNSPEAGRNPAPKEACLFEG
mmetsp:Transcript_35103/g.83843  ORF Transcript_35103/g.83843 Transcript_35103/m.83843 type:complete len:90 (-) Transcript_35103:1615-1884(-)